MEWELAKGVARFASDVLTWNNTKQFASFMSDLFTIIASGIAIWIFITKRSEIKSFAATITSFVHQNSLAELRLKLELLGNLNASDQQQRAEIVAIFHDICGQIDGNPVLREKFSDFTARVRKATDRKRTLAETQKRSFVSELREALRHLDVKDIAQYMGNNDA